MTDERLHDRIAEAAMPATTRETLLAEIDQSASAAPPAATARVASPTFGRVEYSSAPVAASKKYIIFSLAEARYAVPINQVLEVGEAQRITPVPNVPEWVLGVTNLRGDIISVVDCGAFLQLHDKITPEESSMCIVRNLRRDLTTSLMVDRIEGMLNLAENLIVLPQASLGDQAFPYLRGVYYHEGQMLNVLNLEGLLSSMELHP